MLFLPCPLFTRAGTFLFPSVFPFFLVSLFPHARIVAPLCVIGPRPHPPRTCFHDFFCQFFSPFPQRSPPLRLTLTLLWSVQTPSLPQPFDVITFAGEKVHHRLGSSWFFFATLVSQRFPSATSFTRTRSPPQTLNPGVCPIGLPLPNFLEPSFQPPFPLAQAFPILSLPPLFTRPRLPVVFFAFELTTLLAA